MLNTIERVTKEIAQEEKLLDPFAHIDSNVEFENAWNVVVNESCSPFLSDEGKEHFITQALNLVMNILKIEVTESNSDTPKRVANMWLNDVFKTYGDKDISELIQECKTFPNESSKPSPIRIADIPFSSFCEHHLLPFFGTVDITYTPKMSGRIIGLSKAPRVVAYFSNRPQLQERLVEDIGKFLVNVIDPENLEVKVTAEHTCVACRGIKSHVTTTTYYNFWSDK